MNDLTVQTKSFSLTPSNLEEAMRFASILAKTELVPKSYQGKPEAIVVAMAWGAEIGLSGLQAVQNIASINGRPSLWGDAALAVVMAHPSYEDHEERIEGAGDQMRAVCTMKRKGKADKTVEFSVNDAKRAGLWGKQGPWTAYPQRMLQMRARGFAMRDQFPDALRGMSLAEESQDIEERDITSRSEVTMPKRRKTAEAAHDPAGEQVAPPQDDIPTAPETDASEPLLTGEEVNWETGEISPPPTPTPTIALSASQVRVVRAQLTAAGVAESAAAAQFGVDRIEAIPAAECNALLGWIKGQRW